MTAFLPPESVIMCDCSSEALRTGKLFRSHAGTEKKKAERRGPPLAGDLGVLDSGKVQEVEPLLVELCGSGAVAGVAGQAAQHTVPQRPQLLRLMLLLTHMRCASTPSFFVASNPHHVFYKAEKQRKGKNPNSKAAKTKSNRNHSNGTTAPSRT
jgi:hypothetical protein